jgi:hypothetical protein
MDIDWSTDTTDFFARFGPLFNSTERRNAISSSVSFLAFVLFPNNAAEDIEDVEDGGKNEDSEEACSVLL